jgi:hypothetical protein
MMFSFSVWVKHCHRWHGGELCNGGHFRCAFAGADAGAPALFGISFAGDGTSGSAWPAALSLRMLSPVSSIL